MRKIEKLPTRRAVVGGGLAVGALLFSRSARTQTGAVQTLPAAPRDGSVDTFHGVTVADPFRPLEDVGRADVKAWIDAQDARARAYLTSLQCREPIRKFFDTILNYPRSSVPMRRGPRYFAFFNDGLASQRSYGVYEHLSGPRRTLIDAARLSTDGTISISDAVPDRRGLRVAYLVSEAGSDRQTLRVRDVEGGFDFRDTLMWCKHTSIAWHPHGRAFFYSRYPGDNDPPDWDRFSQVVFMHFLGQPQSADRLVFRLPEHKGVYLRIDSSADTRQLRITARVGTSEKCGYYVASLEEPTQFSEVFPINAAGFWPFDNVGATHYALTNLDAPNWRLVRIDQADPKPDRWHTVIAETELALDQVRVFDSRLIVKHLDGFDSRISMCDLNGRKVAAVDVGGPARVWFGRSFRSDDHLLLEVNEYKRASRIEWLDFATRKTTLWRASASKHDLADMEVRQVSVTSRDGTRVPLTLIHRRDVALDGDNRTLLYAYGGFSIPMWAGYSETVATWVRLGGIYAIAAIRGGGEFGQRWHDGGRLGRKQNSFDDFIAAAEWLIANRYTRPERLGINGASNGGLLVLATMLQRPELFGAVVAGVPVADMLRFRHLTFGRNWIPEYGDTDVEADFKTLMTYSPLHNIRRTKYPPLLVLTADTDDRVVPAHAYKFVAAMQSEIPDAEVYLKVERRAGHGFGNALEKSLDRTSDTLAFLCERLGGPVLALPKIAQQ